MPETCWLVSGPLFDPFKEGTDAAERIAMRLVREILPLITAERLPIREIARRTSKAPPTPKTCACSSCT